MTVTRRLCEMCRGRSWVVIGGKRRDCPRPGCDHGYVDGQGPGVDLGAAVEYWAHLSVARALLERFGRELPAGMSPSPLPDWPSWTVTLHRVLAGLVAAIDALDDTEPPARPGAHG